MESKDIFWGLVVLPGKRYETEVDRPFRITKACLQPSTAGGKVSSVMVECNNGENFIIANLTQKQFNTTLELAFNEGEKICFKVEGPGTVHLTGNLVPEIEEDDSGDEDIDELEAAAMEAERITKSIKALPVGGLEKESSDSEEEEDEEEEERIVNKRKQANEDKNPNKKAKIEEKEEDGDSEEDSSDDDDDDDEEEDDDSDEDDSTDDELDTEELSEEQAKKIALAKKLYEAARAKVDKEVASSKKAKPVKEPTAALTKNGKEIPKVKETPAVRTLKGGVQIEDLVMGAGAVAQKGNFVGMYYSGKLHGNKKTFDSCLSGKPFRFRLGSGQVIQGWERGVAGMKEGGKRRLTLAPAMGYGARGAPPDIPGNATLVFDIECKYVKQHASQERL